jgi:hypothetical protein
MKKSLPICYLLTAAMLLISNCSVVPITGRKQMHLLPESNMVQMGLTSYSEFLKENTLSTNQASSRSVELVGKKRFNRYQHFLKEECHGERAG